MFKKKKFPARTREARTRDENAQPGMPAAPAWIATLPPGYPDRERHSIK